MDRNLASYPEKGEPFIYPSSLYVKGLRPGRTGKPLQMELRRYLFFPSMYQWRSQSIRLAVRDEAIALAENLVATKVASAVYFAAAKILDPDELSGTGGSVSIEPMP